MPSYQSIILFVVSYLVIPRLTFLPPNLHTVLKLLGPWFLSWAVNKFNTARAVSRSAPVRPAPAKVNLALNLLSISVIVWVVLTFSRFAPENIFVKTQSRLQIEPNVLFTRLRLLRPLTAEDEILRDKFSRSGKNKLLYLTYGPDTLINCIWCATAEGDDERNFFLYSLPKIITPHIAHLAILGISTSSLVGSEGSRFRIHATIAGLLLLIVEAWFMGTYDITQNKRARVLEDIDFVHWRIRLLRFFSFALVDCVLGLVLWLTSTNRWLAKPTSIAERLEMSTRQAEETTHKLRALGLLTNSVNRDPALRGVREEYWRTEGQVMAETVQEEEVMEQINRAVSKIDLRSLEGRVDQVADSILAGIDGMRASQNLTASMLNEAASS